MNHCNKVRSDLSLSNCASGDEGEDDESLFFINTFHQMRKIREMLMILELCDELSLVSDVEES